MASLLKQSILTKSVLACVQRRQTVAPRGLESCSSGASTSGRTSSAAEATPTSWLHQLHARPRGSVRAQSSKTRKLPTASPTDNVKQDVGVPGDGLSREFAVAMAVVADETKCSDIIVLDVAPLVSWTSFMVICTVFSKPQMMAALVRMEKAAMEFHGRERTNQPGSSPWEVLDFGSVVCHVFTADQREHYDIESFYAACDEVELPFLGEGPIDGDGNSLPAGSSRMMDGPGAPKWTTELKF